MAREIYAGKWKPAKSIIDWNILGEPINQRRRPLASTTLKRIEQGIKKFWPEAFLALLQNNRHARSLNLPLPTVTTSGAHFALIEPFLIEYYSNGNAHSIDEPIGTITTKDRFGLVNFKNQIRFRMLQPHELARAQGFPDDYKFTGTKSEIVKQIGNAVPCNTARALVYEGD